MNRILYFLGVIMLITSAHNIDTASASASAIASASISSSPIQVIIGVDAAQASTSANAQASSSTPFLLQEGPHEIIALPMVINQSDTLTQVSASALASTSASASEIARASAIASASASAMASAVVNNDTATQAHASANDLTNTSIRQLYASAQAAATVVEKGSINGVNIAQTYTHTQVTQNGITVSSSQSFTDYEIGLPANAQSLSHSDTNQINSLNKIKLRALVTNNNSATLVTILSVLVLLIIFY